jgi:hypothetical protein
MFTRLRKRSAQTIISRRINVPCAIRLKILKLSYFIDTKPELDHQSTKGLEMMYEKGIYLVVGRADTPWLPACRVGERGAFVYKMPSSRLLLTNLLLVVGLVQASNLRLF